MSESMRWVRALLRASLGARFDPPLEWQHTVGKRLGGCGEAGAWEKSRTEAEFRREAQEQGSRDEAREIFDARSVEIEDAHEQMAALRFGVGDA
jgi:hypothetical protein